MPTADKPWLENAGNIQGVLFLTKLLMSVIKGDTLEAILLVLEPMGESIPEAIKA